MTGPVHLRVLNNQYGDVRLSGSVPDGDHPIGKDLVVTVKLQNAGKGPIVIPDRWPISVSLFAEDSTGKGLAANPVVETMMAPSPPAKECERMLRLETGETVETVKQVDVHTLGIETPGIYNILVGYNPNSMQLACGDAQTYTGLPAISIEVSFSK